MSDKIPQDGTVASERYNLRGWQHVLGNLVWTAYCLGGGIRVLLIILA